MHIHIHKGTFIKQWKSFMDVPKWMNNIFLKNNFGTFQ